jgi:hypothetical protein
MTQLFLNVLLVLAAAALGLRVTSVLVPRIHPWLRLLISLAIGGALTVYVLQVAGQRDVYDLGLGLLVSLSPVGVYDVVKWWYRRARP